MTRQAFSNPYSQPEVLPTKPPLLGWLAISAVILFTIVGIAGGAGGILRQVFPLLCFAVGVFLYARYPTLYIGFTWWLWFLIALIRRVIDYRSGWDLQGIILVTPYLVTLITFVTFVRYLPKSIPMGGLPFILAIFSVIYGFLVGLISFAPIVVFRTLLDWLTPVLFGFHMFVNWRDYPSYRQTIKTVFLWAVLITGAYGIIQFLVAPEWDRFWLIQTKLTSMGKPEPLGIRVWSTMHSPGPFATVMLAGLMLLFSNQHPMNFPASAAGYLSFLLSMARSAWGGWVVAVASLLSNLKPKLQMRLMVTIVVMALCVVPLVTIEPFSGIIGERFASLTNIEKDQSFVDRSKSYDRNLTIALSSVLGNGIGGTWVIDKDGKLLPIVLDSGILDMFFALGWFGAIPYLGGMILLLYNLFQGSEGRNDSFASASRSISLGIFSQLIFSSLMLGLAGIVLWGFIGMGMAAKKYHQHQLTAAISQLQK
ncbi:MAG: O-antigen ligase domain-containing protein [Heteroscytonema crispum UTEX LB 1556]